jgi:2-polyprenyl-3-methyl-5-hydroxy-6-metoxy-1,4-benzoquinol methylase
MKTDNLEERLQNEIEHGRYLVKHGPGEVWNWDRPAGQRRWRRRVEMLMAGLAPGMEVLELGCGSGYFTRELAKSGARITAIDISPDLLEIARCDVPADNVTFLAENAYAMSFENDRFDSVIGISVLHHLDIEKGFSEVFRVLKPGGSICFSEPNMLNPQIAIQKNVPYVKKRLGDSPDETAFFRWQLSRLLQRHGFVDVQVKPFDFLHPNLPGAMVPSLERACLFMERIPFLREIAGSLHIKAAKPS